MKHTRIAMALGTLAVLSLAATAGAQSRKPSNAETGLIGIKLYDSGVRVVSVYGTPDEVQAVGTGGGSAPGPSGAGGAGGALGRGGGGSGGSAPSTGPVGAQSNPFTFGDEMLYQSRPGGTEGGGGKGGGQQPGAQPIGAGGAGRGGPGAVGGGGGGDRILYTRWVYNRGGSKYGFVLNRFNQVVQVEAIGIQNNKVRTRRGIGFGATFAQVIKKYQAPDGYEVAGDTVVVRYLTKAKCAFRLARLGPNKPQVVTGIVVAAGKA